MNLCKKTAGNFCYEAGARKVFKFKMPVEPLRPLRLGVRFLSGHGIRNNEDTSHAKAQRTPS
jgi:hypothetical protein